MAAKRSSRRAAARRVAVFTRISKGNRTMMAADPERLAVDARRALDIGRGGIWSTVMVPGRAARWAVGYPTMATSSFGPDRAW